MHVSIALRILIPTAILLVCNCSQANAEQIPIVLHRGPAFPVQKDTFAPQAGRQFTSDWESQRQNDLSAQHQFREWAARSQGQVFLSIFLGAMLLIAIVWSVAEIADGAGDMWTAHRGKLQS
jgi:hypothetical protein